MPNKTVKNFIIVIAVVLLAACVFAFFKTRQDESIYDIGMIKEFEACSGLASSDGEELHVIFLIGQSNCTGCSITSYLKDQANPEDFARYEKGYENIQIVFNLDNNRTSSAGEFRKTDLLCGSYDEEFGPEVGLADVLTKELPNEKFAIVKFSMSGYSLNWHWLRHYKRGEIYNAFAIFAKQSLDYMKSMGYKVSLDAICWMQGESDTAEENARRYYKNQKFFMRYLREDFSEYKTLPDIYFIDAGISDSPYCLPGYPEVNESKEKLSKLSEYNIYFPTIENGLTTMNEPYYEPDIGHYDAMSEIKLGELYGEEVVRVLK